MKSGYILQIFRQLRRNLIDKTKRTSLIWLVVPKLKVLGDFSSIDAKRKTILIVLQDGLRNEESILCYNIGEELVKRYNVIALFLHAGELIEDFYALGAIAVGPKKIPDSRLHDELAIKQIVDETQLEFALVNSLESSSVLPALAKHNIPTISFFHECEIESGSKEALIEMLFWSGEIVFPTHKAREKVVAKYPNLSVRNYPVIPNGCNCNSSGEIENIEISARLDMQKFDMANYVSQIEQLALMELDHVRQSELDIHEIAKSDLPKSDYYPDHLRYHSRNEVIRWYVRSWASCMGKPKLFPGFHPGIYREQHSGEVVGIDPLADYLRSGQPLGPWFSELITSEEEAKPLSTELRIGLHIHAYYPELFPEILHRLMQNRVRPDLLISVINEAARLTITSHLESYSGGAVDIRIVPNRGRDIGPFLTEFSDTLRNNYDLIGHLHTKKTADIADESIGKNWYYFLLENLLGGQKQMADIILGRMARDKDIMMVFPDDPYVVGWGKNFNIAETFLVKSGIKNLFQELYFPVGTMFWARPAGLKVLFDLHLGWEDYPEEPLPYDGSVLHALERLFGVLATSGGGSILLTNVSGSTR